MQKLTHKFFANTVLLGFFLFFSNSSYSQLAQQLQDIGNLLNDAVFISDRYFTPATDAAVYQESSNWMSSPKVRKLWSFTLSAHGNIFFVPNRDRNFDISNSNLKFFTLQDKDHNPISNSTVPSALGPKSYTRLVGQIGTSPVSVWSPDGINENYVTYPYLQGSLGLWKGTEIMGKFSTKVNLSKGKYQVYGFGIKHNVSQYFTFLKRNKINLAFLGGYSKEEIGFDFLDIQTDYGNLGLNQITGHVKTSQIQVSISKEFKRFEVMTSFITNKSDFTYDVSGPKGAIENIIPLQDIVNIKLQEINKTKVNAMGELSCRYRISKLFLQSSIAFGKFVNSNVSLQYEFN